MRALTLPLLVPAFQWFYNLKTEFIYHAGTKFENGNVLSNGGRVLNVTSTGNSFLKIRKKIIKIIKRLNWKTGYLRKDIGWKVINKNENY